jgi:hypothetical protein
MSSTLLSFCLLAGLSEGQPPEAPAVPVPAAPPIVAPIIIAPDCPVPISLCDFCQSFKPVPGNYEILFLHPVKCCPVRVCFTLPPGCPKVCCSKREIVFDYGCCAVTIRFKILFGGVKVIYS